LKKPLFAAALSFAFALAAPLAPQLALAACPTHYVDGKPPEFRNQKLAVNTQELCYGVFGIMHSGVTRTPLWAAEHLTADNIEQARELDRENSFHPEERLPRQHRAELSDYARSGFDRGHMAPNGDMPDRNAQRDSFTLANMVPQDGDNNRHVWAGIEQAVRKLAQKEGDLYVLTGPAFLGTDLRKIGNVLVPTHLYKVVYSPRQRAGGAYFVENRPDVSYVTMTVAELEKRIGINLLPSLTDQQKQTMLKLPNAKPRKSKR
jgi:endonuclease G